MESIRVGDLVRTDDNSGIASSGILGNFEPVIGFLHVVGKLEVGVELLKI